MARPSPSKSRSRSHSKRTPGKKHASKSPARSHKRKQQPVSKTPTQARSRSRSTSRSRKASTAPASVRQRSRSRGRATPQASTKRQPGRPSMSPPKQVQQMQQARRRPLPTRPISPAPSSRSKSRNAGVIGRFTNGVRSALFNNQAAVRLRRALNRPYGQRIRKTARVHWKHYAIAALIILLAVIVYKFSNEIVVNLRQISKQMSDFAQNQYETKRKIFGIYLEQAQKVLDDAKRKYLADDAPKSPHPPTQPPLTRRTANREDSLPPSSTKEGEWAGVG